jgi:hypothetical protein
VIEVGTYWKHKDGTVVQVVAVSTLLEGSMNHIVTYRRFSSMTNLYSLTVKEFKENMSNIVIDVDKILSFLNSVMSFLRDAPIYSGVCCCGSEMDHFVDDHTPTDMAQYTVFKLIEQYDKMLQEQSCKSF